jgi:hypothetical protein
MSLPLILSLRANCLIGLKNKGVAGILKGFVPLPQQQKIIIRGQSLDANGNPLGGTTVKLYRTIDDVNVAQTTSDGSGNYSFTVGLGMKYYTVHYLAGTPDVAGTSVNTLLGS